MNTLNSILTGAFGLFFRPFRSLDPIWALTAISFVVGIFMLWVFGKVSNQDAIRKIRDKIRGNIIGIRLFGDDLVQLFRMQGRIVRQTLTYMRHALMPMLVLLVPVLLVLTQLNLWFALQPLEPGNTAMVKVKLLHTSPVKEPVELDVPAGVTIETPAVRIESLREVAWRIRADAPGRYDLTVKAGLQEVRKQLLVGSGWDAVSPLRTSSIVDLLLYPGERGLDGSGRIEAVTVSYDPLPLRIFGFDVFGGWLAFFFVASIAFGFAFRRVLGVEI